MKVNAVSSQPNFNGKYMFDNNLSHAQLRNFRLALKDMDIYKKEYDLKIFNDYSMDKLCKENEHIICVRAENDKMRRSSEIFIEPNEQKIEHIIRDRVLKVSADYEEKYKKPSLIDKLKKFFGKY